MTARLIILGLLREKPYYGYELKRTMQERYMDEWTQVAFGSIYYALRHMTQEGLVQPEATERDGNRPSRTVYSITEVGRLEFTRLLREAWQAPPTMSPELMRICILFMQELPAEEITTHLTHRAKTIMRSIEHLKHVGQEVSAKGAPWTAQYIVSYDIGLWQKSLEWIQGLLEDIQSGRITWRTSNHEPNALP
jgi:DNA-binding PadR family transcriptional regulator